MKNRIEGQSSEGSDKNYVRAKESDLPKLLKIPELVDKFNVSYQKVRELIDQGEIKAYKIGGQIRIDPESVLEFIKRGGTPKPPEK